MAYGVRAHLTWREESGAPVRGGTAAGRECPWSWWRRMRCVVQNEARVKGGRGLLVGCYFSKVGGLELGLHI